MRALILLPLLLLNAACRQEQPAPEQQTAEVGLNVYAGEGRDRLCLRAEQGSEAGFVTFEETGDNNCMVRGTYDRTANAIVPNGDAACRIPVTIEGNSVRLGAASTTCTYYCGPKASYAGKRFTAMPPGTPSPADLAGDPLC